MKEIFEFNHVGFAKLNKNEVKIFKELIDLIAEDESAALVINPSTTFPKENKLRSEEKEIIEYALKKIPPERLVVAETNDYEKILNDAEKKLKDKIARSTKLIPMGVYAESCNLTYSFPLAERLKIDPKNVLPYLRFSKSILGKRMDITSPGPFFRKKIPGKRGYVFEFDKQAAEKYKRLLEDKGGVLRPVPSILRRLKRRKK